MEAVLVDGILLNMDFSAALLLGLIQGITEFLPVSSTGHLVLAREVLANDITYGLAVDGVLHLATTLAIIIYFRQDIWILLQAFMRKLGRLPANEKDLTLLSALAIGTIPAVVLGLLFEDFMTTHFQNPMTVAVTLFVSAVFFMYAEWRYYLHPPQGLITTKKGWQVGLFQALALIPGFSRSGATLAGGMLIGLSRVEAARFSFLLAIPITLGVGVKKLFDLTIITSEVAWLPIAFGAVVSFFTAILVIHFFLSFIRKYTLWPFIWYKIILAMLVGYVAIFI